MGDAPIPRPPKGTGPAGRKLWNAVVVPFEVADHEMPLLREAVRVADTCARLQEVVEADGEMITDRFGQPRTHPAVIELRNERALLSRLIVSLRVPIGDAEQHPAKTAPDRRQQRRGTRGFYAVQGGAS